MVRSFWEELVVSSKIFAFVMFLAVAGAYNHARAQQTPPLERLISISFENEPIASVLEKLEQRAGFTFSYSPSILDAEKLFSQKFTGRSIREILDSMFSGSLQYKERGNYIILIRAPDPPPRSSTERAVIIKGYVTNAITGERVPRVSIYDKESLSGAITSDFGYFELKIIGERQNHSIVFNKRSFRDTVLQIQPGGHQAIEIAMQPIERVVVDRLAENSLVPDSVRVPKGVIAPVKTGSSRPSHINMENIRDTLYSKVQVSFLPFAGTNHVLSGNVVNDYSFNIIGGYSLGVNRFEIASVFNVDRGNVRGSQLAGTFNAVGGSVQGLQAAGAFNLTGGAVKGTQLAGLLNVNFSSATGPQFAGVLNVNGTNSRGARFAGIGNVQIMDYRGAQFAGVFNLATHHVQGFQMAGVLNVARTVDGVQFGVINVTDSIKGIPIGFLSFVRKGYHKIEISADELFFASIAFRTGVRQFYNIFTAGIKPDDFGDPLWKIGYGVGTAPRLSERLSLNIDLVSNHVSHGHFNDDLGQLSTAYLGVDFQVGSKFSITAGVTMNGYLTHTDETHPDIFTRFTPHFVYDKDVGDHSHLSMWWGGKIGLRFF